jgi:hypothetical protein
MADLGGAVVEVGYNELEVAAAVLAWEVWMRREGKEEEEKEKEKVNKDGKERGREGEKGRKEEREMRWESE